MVRALPGLGQLVSRAAQGFPCSPHTVALPEGSIGREQVTALLRPQSVQLFPGDWSIKASKDCQWKDLLPLQHCQEQPDWNYFFLKSAELWGWDFPSDLGAQWFHSLGCFEKTPRILSVLRGVQTDLGTAQGSGLLVMKKECPSKPYRDKGCTQMYKCCAITRHHLCIKGVFAVTPTS